MWVWTLSLCPLGRDNRTVTLAALGLYVAKEGVPRLCPLGVGVGSPRILQPPGKDILTGVSSEDWEHPDHPGVPCLETFPHSLLQQDRV